MKRFLKNQAGTSMAEFALVASVFMMIIFGIIEFGRMLYTYNALADAARRGARYAVLHPQNSNTCVRNVIIYGETHVTVQTVTPAWPALVNNIPPSTLSIAHASADPACN